MKVFNLRCANGHGFEGWFSNEEDHARQVSQGLLSCPLCGDHEVVRLPSAPRLNLSGAQRDTSSAEPATVQPPKPAPEADVGQQLQAHWLRAVREVLDRTEDVGDRFPEEARRIHHGESEERGIRGQATPEEREALREEGIEVHSLPVPKDWTGPRH